MKEHENKKEYKNFRMRYSNMIFVVANIPISFNFANKANFFHFAGETPTISGLYQIKPSCQVRLTGRTKPKNFEH